MKRMQPCYRLEFAQTHLITCEYRIWARAPWKSFVVPW